MVRKKRTSEENVHREEIRELLQLADVNSMDDIQDDISRGLARMKTQI